MKTIEGKIDIEGIKRCYAEGAIAEITCPGCGNKLKHDLSGDYLSYPEVGKETTIYFYCHTCEEAGKKDYEFECKAKVKAATITIEYDPDSVEQT